MPDHWLVLLLIGLAAGVLSGMFGIGGGVVIVPALIAFVAFELQQAVGTSLAALLMPVAIFAVIAYYRAGMIHLRVAVPIAVGLIFGGLVGAEFALGLPTDTLQRLYGIFLLYVSWRFIEPTKWLAERRNGKPAVPPEPDPMIERSWLLMLAVGLGAGVLSGMFGIGGGIVIVPLLVGLLRFDPKIAVGTSLGAQLPPVGIASVIAYYNADKLEIGPAALVAVGLVFGSFVGAKIALGLPSATVKRLYGIFLLFMGIRFLLQL